MSVTPPRHAPGRRASTHANWGVLVTKRNDLLTTAEAAAYVGLSPRTLERYRVTGEGPTYLKVGRRVLYRRTDLDKWLDMKVRRSTSDPGPQ